MSEPGGALPSPEASASTSASTSRGVQIGEVLLGKYRVERELGRGGMGYVVAARHLDLGELVAIKMILGEYAANDEMVRRFMREARAAAQIASEHVVRVNDVGRLPSGEPYMVMELLKGEDLEEVLGRAPLDIPGGVDLLLQVIEAVAEAHAVGIVHRDLKPANLFLTRRRSGAACVKVLDFGISKLIGDETSRTHTATPGVLGSPLYMSPEQLRTPGEVDGRGDVWSLGVILFQMLTQDFPFVAETLPQLLIKVLDSEPVRLRSLLPLAPEGLEQVIVRALAKDRELRYASVTDLALALAPFGTEASRVSLASIESALPSRAGVSPTLPAPPSSESAISASDSVEGAALGKARTLAMWGESTSTLEPVESPSESAEQAPASPRGRRMLWASVAIGATSLAVLAAVGLTRAPMSPAQSGGASGITGPEVGAAAARGSSTAPYELAPVPSLRLPEGTPSAPGSDGTSSAVAASASAPSSTARALKAKPPGTNASPPAGEKPKPVASASSAAVSPPPPPNCSPPYKIDGNGKHVPKPECL